VRVFARDESGATAIEYGLIVSGIFLAVVTGVSLFASNANIMFNKIATAVGGAMG
jgi:pilus assembly protein Flp/PilA